MKKIFTLLLIWVGFVLNAQYSKEIVLNWDGFRSQKINKQTFNYPYFKGDSFVVDIDAGTILCSTVFDVPMLVSESSLVIEDVVYENITEDGLFGLDKNKIPSEIKAKLESVIARNTYVGSFVFNPIIQKDGVYKKVVSLRFSYNLGSNANFRSANSTFQIYNSVLATGSWFRFYVEKSGVYRISKQFLQSLGFNVNVDPRNIKIYGNGGRMLPLLNSIYYPEDLEENAVQFIGESDGYFNDNDYILFYAEGVDTWNEESLTKNNLFSNKSYYYVTYSNAPGKRIQTAIQPSAAPSLNLDYYNSEIIYEKDLVNVGKVGRRWFGEKFDVIDNQSFNFNIPNLDTTIPVSFKINLASKSFGDSSFEVKVNSSIIGTVNFQALTQFSGIQGYENALNSVLNVGSSNLTVNLKYNNGGVPTSVGYLDFIKISARSFLKGYNKQFKFSNLEQQNNIGVGQYSVLNAARIRQIWDITDLYNVKTYINSDNLSTFTFKVGLGELRKYIAVDAFDLYTPLKDANSYVFNQNLKGKIFLNNQGVFQDIDYLIITPNFLKSQADRLANFHRNNSGLNTKVVTLESIYHEFSSGKQDVAAIRNFIKYVYFNASTVANRVKYVNLFGDASYDYKNRLFNNSNIVPVFHGFNPNEAETNNTTNMSLFNSFMSDDFYALMDDTEGTMTGIIDGIDIAVGRMLVSNLLQAKEMVDKVFEYYDKKSYGKWRNTYVIYSDDADDLSDSTLQFDLDNMADILTTNKPFVNMKKIHTDSYVQEIAAGGERYPEAKNDFLDALQLGGLVFNYFGHGNEVSLARERLFEKIDAQNLGNRYRYPLFITITCEFTRFDDPNRFTGGEYMYWNKSGGAIGLIATTRQIGVTTGYTMNYNLSEDLYAFGSSNYPTISEALRLTKIATGSTNRRVVFYIGDPALKLAIPKPKVVLTAVNDIPFGQPWPNFQALDLMKVSGQVLDENDNLISNYNGDVAIQIFDKDINRSTLANDGTMNSSGQLVVMDFETLGETIFRGNATVVNGEFEISFVVPQDIKIPIGNGRISFYAKRELPTLEDQTGYNEEIQVGGVNLNAEADNIPPKIRIYMNDESFVSGGLSNCSPILLVFLEDANGINTASGIGHDIVAVLDGDESNPYILNDYYETELDDFTKGKIKFPFRNIEPGMHTLVIKAWDVYNNLVTSEIQFNAVCSDDGLKIERVLNYPNPFVNYTEFWFTHNMPFEPLDVQVQILTITGKLVKTINQQVITDGFLCREVKWDGRDDFGDKIGKGVYVYRLTVKSTTTGNQTQKYEKLVIL